ncbi:MAG TPA: erythromycin esterase family protein [Thermoanaerobaculia bacterium]|jgi:erythromycin esterase
MRASRPSLARFLVLAALALLALPAAAVTDTDNGNANPGNYANAVGPGVYRLDGFDPGLPFDDLEPLRRIVGNARVVGLGESIHTSGGFYTLKHRVFRFLVEEMGFRAFGFETPWVHAEAAAAYVQTCEGDLPAILGGLSRPWRSTEVQDLLQWMCEWNQDHPQPQDRLHFYGFDIQNQAQPDAAALIAYLERIGFAADHPWIQSIQVCDGVVESFWPSRPFPSADRYQQCQQALVAIASYFDENEKALVERTSREELAWARIRLVGQQTWQEEIFFIRADFFRGYTARDRGMAYVAQAIRDLRFPHARVALWAHNGHIIHDAVPYVGTPAMGNFLSAELDGHYVTVALTASEVYVDWVPAGRCGLQTHLSVPGAVAVEDVLRGLGQGALLVDLNPRGSHPALLEPGAVYGLADGTLVPAEGFDALLYLETSPAMHPLAWASCQP